MAKEKFFMICKKLKIEESYICVEMMFWWEDVRGKKLWLEKVMVPL